MVRRGKIIILTAPSGSGKTTLARRLLHDFPQIRFSVSATTRKPREGEIDGVHYYFLSGEDFRKKLKNGEFLESEEFYNGTMYGTLREHVENQLNSGYFSLLDVEVKGASNVKSMYGDECLSVFVRPPSIEVLRDRLISRGTETPESLQTRLERAGMELEYEQYFDAVIVNDNLDRAYQELRKVVEAFILNT